MKLIHAAIAASVLFAGVTSVWGQRVGDVIAAPAALRLYESLPQGLYCTDSPSVATVAAGERLRVLSVTNLPCALVLGRNYVEIERIGLRDHAAPRRGYVRLS